MSRTSTPRRDRRAPESRSPRRRAGRSCQEERDQAGDEAVEEAGLREREAEPLDGRDLVTHLGLTSNGLDDLAEDDADADTGADGAEAATHADRDRLAGGRGGLRRIALGEDEAQDGQEGVHFGGLLLVRFGDRAAEVDRREGGEDERLQRGYQAD